jgi:flagellar basal-body rod modification protein FlgD
MVDPVTSAAAAGAQGSGTNSKAALADNFEMFLTLLTEQMKNQDPLSPLDSTEFVNQLVNFSSVEQLINQNDSLDKLIGLQVANVGGATVGYLGKEIRVHDAENQLTPNGAAWAYQLADDAEPTAVTLTVTDAEGKVVYEQDGSLDPGEHGFYWDGLDNSGEPLPQGAYTLEVAAHDENNKTIASSISAFGTVTGVDLSGEEPVLLIGNARAPFSLIEAVRDPVPAQQAPDPNPEDNQDTGA